MTKIAGCKIIIIFDLLFIYEQYLMGSKFEMEICLGSSCFSRGNKEVVMFIKDYLRRNHLDDRVIFKGARCLGHCSNGPNLVINRKVVEGVTVDRVEKILEENLAEIR